MTEIMARINAEGRVELIDDRSARIESAATLTPFDTAYLARGMLACAAALSSASPPKAGAIGGDAHLPVMKWVVTSSTLTSQPVLIFSIPPGIELTFAMSSQGAKALGEALVSQAEGLLPPEDRHSTVH